MKVSAEAALSAAASEALWAEIPLQRVPAHGELSCRLEQSHGVLGRDIGLDVMVRPTNVSSSFAQRSNTPFDLGTDFGRFGKREPLGADPTEEGDVPAVLPFEFFGRDGQCVQLNGFPYIDTDVDQVR